MAVESQFYLLLPIFGLALHRFASAKRRSSIIVLSLLVAVSPLLYVTLRWLLRRYAADAAPHHTLLYTLGFLVTFGTGAALGFIDVGLTSARFSDRFCRRLPRLARLAGIGGLLLLLVQAVATALRPGLMNEPLRFLGVISYSLYIWNIPLFKHAVLPVADVIRSDALTVVVDVLGTFLIVIPASYVSFMVVERPIHSARFRLR